MRFSLECDEQELLEKGEQLLHELAEAIEPFNRELGETLHKALPHKEANLKYKVLQQIHDRERKEYERLMKLMVKDIGKVLEGNLEKAFIAEAGEAGGEAEDEDKLEPGDVDPQTGDLVPDPEDEEDEEDEEGDVEKSITPMDGLTPQGYRKKPGPGGKPIYVKEESKPEKKELPITRQEFLDALQEFVSASDSLEEAIDDLKSSGMETLYTPQGDVPMGIVLRELETWKPKSLPKGETIKVYHTTDQETAERMIKEGVIPQLKPWTQASRDYAEGEQATFSPGQGVSRGIYIGEDPKDVESYGQITLEIEIPKSLIKVSPEQEVLGVKSPMESLSTHDGAVVMRSIPPEAIKLMKSESYDPTYKIAEQDQKKYDAVRAEMKKKGYKDSDFDDKKGPFYGWSVNELIEFMKDHRGERK